MEETRRNSAFAPSPWHSAARTAAGQHRCSSIDPPILPHSGPSPAGGRCAAVHPGRGGMRGARGARTSSRSLEVCPAEQHRAAATAAVEVTNMIVQPGCRIVHSRGPEENFTSYYEQLEALSPAAQAAPSEWRSYASSVAASKAPTLAPSPLPSTRSTPAGKMTPGHRNHASDAAANRKQFEQRCSDKLCSQGTGDVALWLSMTPHSSANAHSASSPSASRAAERVQDGGLGFLFTVWAHNPVHTPPPANVHA